MPLLARRFLYTIAGLIALVLAVAIGWNLFQDKLMRLAFVPGGGFTAPGGTIDYGEARNWVARPGLAGDPSHYLPAGYTPTTRPTTRAAVFFVPPTTYIAKDRWNAPLDDASANDRLKLFVMSQASAFTGVGDVWAPRYRQATMGAFLTDRGDAQRALDFAYADVERAFDAFLKANPDGPILLTGHSQGSLHVMTLLAKRIAGTPVAGRIVAAYLVGWPVSRTADLPRLGLPACEQPGQAGCVTSWQSFAEPADPRMVQEAYDRSIGLIGVARRGTPFLCVNPLTGVAGGSASADANLGALVPEAGLSGAALTAKLVPAACAASGFLSIGSPPKGYDAYVLPGNNFHVFDYALFWANIRADAERRFAAYESAHATKPR